MVIAPLTLLNDCLPPASLTFIWTYMSLHFLMPCTGKLWNSLHVFFFFHLPSTWTLWRWGYRDTLGTKLDCVFQTLLLFYLTEWGLWGFFSGMFFNLEPVSLCCEKYRIKKRRPDFCGGRRGLACWGSPHMYSFVRRHTPTPAAGDQWKTNIQHTHRWSANNTVESATILTLRKQKNINEKM